MITRRLILLATMACSTIVMVATVAGEQSRPFLVPFGVLQVIFLPGYAFSCAVLPGLRKMERALVSLGLSLSLAVLGGIALNLTGLGLSPVSWAGFLGTASIVSATIAIRREGNEEAATQAWWPLSRRKAFDIGLALAILCLAVAIAVQSTRIDDTAFTQLWALSSLDGQSAILEVGIRNYEGTEALYRVTVEDTWGLIADWEHVSLADGSEWTGRLGLSGVPEEPLRVMLYRDGALDSAYRWLDIWPSSFRAP